MDGGIRPIEDHVIKNLPTEWGTSMDLVHNPEAVQDAMKRQGHTELRKNRIGIIYFSNEGGMFLHFTDDDSVYFLPMERIDAR